jgi:NADPH:quinone reductase
MRRVMVNALGGPEQLIIEEVSDELRPGPGQILVDVEASGVNYLDVYQRKGISKVELPYTPGLEGVGRAREVGEGIGSDTDRLDADRRVAWINVLGSYAQQVVIPAAQAIPVPVSVADLLSQAHPTSSAGRTQPSGCRLHAELLRSPDI